MSDNKGNREVNFKSERFIFGIIGLLMILLAVLISTFKNMSAEPVKMLFALGSAAFAAMILGFIEVQYKNKLQAGGGFAIFVIVFFNAPFIIPEKIEIAGNIYYDEKLLDNASVYVENLNKYVTNNTGHFQVTIPKDDIKNKQVIKIIVEHTDLRKDFSISTEEVLNNLKLDLKKDYIDLPDILSWEIADTACKKNKGKLPKIEDFKKYKDLDSTKQYWTSDVVIGIEDKAYAFSKDQFEKSRGKEIELSVRCKN